MFRRNIWVSPFWEGSVSDVVETIGWDRVLFGSDYPHPEGLAEPKGFFSTPRAWTDAAPTTSWATTPAASWGLPIANPDPDAVKPPALAHTPVGKPMTDTHTGPQQRTQVDLDHHSPEFREDPFGTFDEIRSGCPVAHSDHHGGFWAFVDYASVFDAARDDDLFNSYPSVGVPASGMPFPSCRSSLIRRNPGAARGHAPPVLPRIGREARPVALQMADEQSTSSSRAAMRHRRRA